MGRKYEKCEIGIHNRFDVEVVDAKTGEIIQRARGYNVVCNTIYNYLAGQNNTSGPVEGYGRQIVFGSGTGTPSATDTALFSKVGSKSASTPSMVIDREHEVITFSRSITISNTEYVDNILSEVGLSPNGTLITTHSVLQDMNGNPISIHHTNTDIINIYSTVYVHYSTTLSNLSLILSNPETERTGPGWEGGNFAALLSGLSGRLYYYTWYLYVYGDAFYLWYYDNQAIYREQNFSYDGPDPSVVGNIANKTLTMTFPQVPVGQMNPKNESGNISGYLTNSMKRLTIYNSRGDRFTFDNPSKSSVTGESVGTGDGTTLKFRTKFDCPENAKVYVNGIQTQDVQVLKAPVSDFAYLYGGRNDERWTPYFTEVKKIDGVIYNAQEMNQASSNGKDANVTWENRLSPLGMGMTAWTGSISDDYENWTSVDGNLTNAQKSSKYYKGSAYTNRQRVTDYDGYNIVFTNPPANGDVITIDYDTDYITKDSDHVLDVSITFTFGEYQGE